jgi:CRISPR-associated protein Cmr3
MPKKSREGPLQSLRPLVSRAVPGWSETPQGRAGLRPLWSCDRTPGEPASGYLSPQGLRAFLRSADVPPGERFKGTDLMDTDHRTGIAIEPDRLTAAESLIYGASFLSLKRNVALGTQETKYDIVFYAEVAVTPAAGESPFAGIKTFAWGGEGRRVAIRATVPFPWHESESNGGKPLLVLTTPGLFADPSRPAILNGHIVSAAVPSSVPVSGWDLARGGPRPNRFATAAGSVFFLDQLPQNLPSSLSDDDFDAQQGWGCYVKGTWTDE